MNPQAVVKAVDKKLNYYFSVKRLEDDFTVAWPEKPVSTPSRTGGGQPSKKHSKEPPPMLIKAKCDSEMSTNNAVSLRERRLRKHIKSIMEEQQNQQLLSSCISSPYAMPLVRPTSGRIAGIKPGKSKPKHRRRRAFSAGPTQRQATSNSATSAMSNANQNKLISMASKLIVATETVALPKGRRHTREIQTDSDSHLLSPIDRVALLPHGQSSFSDPGPSPLFQMRDRKFHPKSQNQRNLKYRGQKSESLDLPPSSTLYTDTDSQDEIQTQLHRMRVSNQLESPQDSFNKIRQSRLGHDRIVIHPPSTAQPQRRRMLQKKAGVDEDYEADCCSFSSSDASMIAMPWMAWSGKRHSNVTDISTQTLLHQGTQTPNLQFSDDQVQDWRTETSNGEQFRLHEPMNPATIVQSPAYSSQSNQGSFGMFGQTAASTDTSTQTRLSGLQPKVITYEIHIVTGDKEGAGTNADVKMTLIGRQNHSSERPLVLSKTNPKPFKRNQVDVFLMDSIFLGDLCSVRLGHNGTSTGSSWFLDSVIVKEGVNAHEGYLFICQRWLSAKEGDGQIVRDIPLADIIPVSQFPPTSPKGASNGSCCCHSQTKACNQANGDAGQQHHTSNVGQHHKEQGGRQQQHTPDSHWLAGFTDQRTLQDTIPHNSLKDSGCQCSCGNNATNGDNNHTQKLVVTPPVEDKPRKVPNRFKLHGNSVGVVRYVSDNVQKKMQERSRKEAEIQATLKAARDAEAKVLQAENKTRLQLIEEAKKKAFSSRRNMLRSGLVASNAAAAFNDVIKQASNRQDNATLQSEAVQKQERNIEQAPQLSQQQETENVAPETPELSRVRMESEKEAHARREKEIMDEQQRLVKKLELLRQQQESHLELQAKETTQEHHRNEVQEHRRNEVQEHHRNEVEEQTDRREWQGGLESQPTEAADTNDDDNEEIEFTEKGRQLQKDDSLHQSPTSPEDGVEQQSKTIHEACKDGDVDAVRLLLSKNPAAKSIPDEKGWHPLHIAVSKGHLPVVRLLSISGANLKEETQTGYTAMHLAALHGHVNCAMILAAMGSPVNCRTVDNFTPLHCAAMSGHSECAKWFLSNRADINAADIHGRTPLDIADEYQQQDCYKLIKTIKDDLDKNTSALSLLRSPPHKKPSHGARVVNAVGSENTNSSDGSDDGDGDTWKSDSEGPCTSSDEQGDSLASLERRPSTVQQKSALALQEKKRIYNNQKSQMERRESSFLDSIRMDVDHSVEDDF